MLVKNKRLSTRQFDATFSSGRVIRMPHFLVRYAPVSGKNRWAVVVSKKHTRTAAGRNAARRKMYSAIESMIQKNVYEGNFILISTTPLPMSVHEIEQELSAALVGRAV